MRFCDPVVTLLWFPAKWKRWSAPPFFFCCLSKKSPFFSQASRSTTSSSSATSTAGSQIKTKVFLFMPTQQSARLECLNAMKALNERCGRDWFEIFFSHQNSTPPARSKGNQVLSSLSRIGPRFHQKNRTTSRWSASGPPPPALHGPPTTEKYWAHEGIHTSAFRVYVSITRPFHLNVYLGIYLKCSTLSCKSTE